VNDVEKKLSSVNWDFTDAPTNNGIHAIHPYPAKFIPQIPAKLIELFRENSSSVVLDPFCGCGTTLVEAQRFGLDTIGVDLHPLACLISRVKVNPLPDGLIETGKKVSITAREKYSGNSVIIPIIPRLDHWFKADIQKALASIVSQIQSESIFADALKLALSSIIVRVSNQESDTRYAAIEKDVCAGDVFLLFDRAVKNVANAVYALRSNLFYPLGNAKVINKDTLRLTTEDLPSNIGLVITSPPYPNAYEYWLYHKYRMYWLGMDPIQVRKYEIGARPNYFRVNPQNEYDFEKQMEITFGLLSKVMNKNAKACFIVGRSVLHGRVIDNVSILERAANLHGFITEGMVLRHIAKTRKTFNPENSKINEEHIVVFSCK